LSKAFQQQLSRLNILLVCEPGAEEQSLLRHLQRTRATVRHVWPAPETIGENTDLMIAQYMRGIGQRLSWVPGEAKAAFIILLPQNGQYDLAEVRGALPDSVIYRPFLPHAIDVALMLALDHFSYGKRQRLRISRLDENMRALRDIEKAKHAIMSSQDIGESDAYRVLRDMAMEKRVTIAEVAGRMVDSAETRT
jgi:AmiR/NasT family two-component response regulator